MTRFLLFIFLALFPFTSFAKECETMQEQAAYDFGKKIQNAVRNKDKEALIELFDGEVKNGPRIAFIRDQDFDAVFSDDWQSMVTSEEPSCTTVGWRGHMLGRGMIWYDQAVTDGDDSRFYISAINNTPPEPQILGQPIAWMHHGTALPPSCFIYTGMSADNFQEIALQNGLSDNIDDPEFIQFSQYPAKFISRQIPLSADNGLFINIDECIEQTDLYIIKDYKVSYPINEYGQYFADSYSVLAQLPNKICEQQIDTTVHDCYAIERTTETGGTIGSDGNVGLYATFDIDGDTFITPLQYFGSVNNARNFIDDALASPVTKLFNYIKN